MRYLHSFRKLKSRKRSGPVGKRVRPRGPGLTLRGALFVWLGQLSETGRRDHQPSRQPRVVRLQGRSVLFPCDRLAWAGCRKCQFPNGGFNAGRFGHFLTICFFWYHTGPLKPPILIHRPAGKDEAPRNYGPSCRPSLMRVLRPPRRSFV